MPPFDPGYFELGSLGLSVGLVVIYHFRQRVRAKVDPASSTHAVNAAARLRWVATVMANAASDVLAVQTLRNSVMAASLMASTAVLLIIGTLNLATDFERAARLVLVLDPTGTLGTHARAFGLLLLLADFFVAFFFFTMAVRLYNHVGFMVALRTDAGPEFTPARVAAYLDRAGHFYALGTRTFYFCVPLVFGVFGPVFMLLATVFLLAALHVIDRVPPS